MKQWKLHISPRLLLSVAALLVMGCLVATIGVSFARYREEQKEGIIFEVGQSSLVFLGSVASDGFTTTQTAWAEVDGQMQLSFAVSNGIAQDRRTTVDQQVSIRVIGSLGAWNSEREEQLTLTVEGNTYSAAVTPIAEGTALHNEFGDGWEFRFLDENGNERTWELSGDQLSYIEMRLSVDSAAVGDTGLLRLQAIGEVK